MKLIDADKLRAEIERRKTHFNKEATKYQYRHIDYANSCYGARDALRDLENFLDTLSEEPDKSLDAVAKEYSLPFCGGRDLFMSDIADAFKAGAKWQKEQMLKDAVEGEILMQYSGRLCAETIHAINEDKFKLGDKVRIVIVKED